MKTLLTVLGFLILMGFLYWLRVYPFREKKTKEPERTAQARVLSHRVTTGANRTGRSSGMGYNYQVRFRLEDGGEIELYSHDYEYGALREGMTGALTWQGPYFLAFQED